MSGEPVVVLGGFKNIIDQKVRPVLAEYGFDVVEHLERSRPSLPRVRFLFILVDCDGNLMDTAQLHVKSHGGKIVRITRKEPAIRRACEQLGRTRQAAPVVTRAASTPKPPPRPLWARTMTREGQQHVCVCAQGHRLSKPVAEALPDVCPMCVLVAQPISPELHDVVAAPPIASSHPTQETHVANPQPAKDKDKTDKDKALRDAIKSLHAIMISDPSIKRVTVNDDGTYGVRRVVITDDEGEVGP